MEAPTWLRHTLEEIVGQIRRLLDVSGCAFQIVDFEEGMIRPAAQWFATDEVRSAMTPVLARPYDAARPGVTEAAIERGEALLIRHFDDWEGAAPLRDRLQAELDPEDASLAWDWYRTSSFISCPVRTAGGRTLGVLALSSRTPQHPLGDDDLHVVQVFADLAALALERTELLDREERRGREDRELNDAARAVSTSLDLEAVYAAIVEQARSLVGAHKVALRRYELATADLRTVAATGMSEEGQRRRFRVGEGMIGQVARTGQAYVSHAADADRFARAFLEREGIGSFVHVPIALGPRLFGVLTASHSEPGYFGAHELERLAALARPAAGAIANALDFQRERRVAEALTRLRATARPRHPGLRGRARLRARGQRGRRRRHLRRLDAAQRRAGRAHRRRQRQGPRGGGAQRDGALLRRGAHVGLRAPGRGADADRPARPRPAAEHELRRRLHGGDRRRAPALGQRRPRAADPARGRWRAGSHRHRRAPRGRGGDPLRGARGALRGRRRPLRRHRRVDRGPPDGVLFGDQRMREVLAALGRQLRPDELVAAVRREVETWTPQLDDDLVLLALRRCL